ncbi:MAG: hypothetical protein ACXACB_09865, partial [Promethearchaeota archaeon]
MNKDENTEIKLFGFRINNTVATILFFLGLLWLIGNIYPIYLLIDFFIRLVGSSISGFSVYSIINEVINLLLYIIIMAINVYILVVCNKSKKSYIESEDTQLKWFGFRLTKTSLMTIGILSILNIILGIFS